MKQYRNPLFDKQGRAHGAAGDSGPQSSTVHKDRWGDLNYTRSERFKGSRGGKGVYAKWDTHRRVYIYGERAR